ncbi:MAG: MCE family protein [Flavobacteriaceae bacterium]|nr:MCE family protein [Flavobacteriaceae bacterium]
MRYSREIKTGVFAVVSILLFILGYQYMKNSKLFQVSREFYVVYENVVGLEAGAPVTINGMRVGKVKNLALANKAGDGVLVTFLLENDFEFPKSSVVKIYASGIIGGNNLAIFPAVGDPIMAQAGDTLRGELESGMIDGLIEKFSPIEKSLLSTLTKVDSVLSDIDQVLDARSKQHLRQSMESLSVAMEQLSQTATGLNVLVDRNQNELDAAFKSILKTSTNLETITDSIAAVNTAQMLKDLSGSISALNQITNSMAQGEGSLGALIQDDGLYQDLRTLTEDAQNLLKDIKSQPKRYVHFSLFGRKDDTQEHQPNKKDN